MLARLVPRCPAAAAVVTDTVTAATEAASGPVRLGLEPAGPGRADAQ